jgi:hypothetical protein
MKYTVYIARTETTLYTLQVDAESETEAENLAHDRYDEGDYDKSEVVWGEEMTHEIKKEEL